MARARDYATEYARRKSLAQEQGWKSYSQKRTAHKAIKTDDDIGLSHYVKVEEPAYYATGGDEGGSEAVTAAWWRALHDKTDSKSRSVNSARAYWYVEVTGQVASYGVWQEKYAPKA